MLGQDLAMRGACENKGYDLTPEDAGYSYGTVEKGIFI